MGKNVICVLFLIISTIAMGYLNIIGFELLNKRRSRIEMGIVSVVGLFLIYGMVLQQWTN